LQEARAMTRLHHRNIIRVFDLVEPSSVSAPLVIVMEWLQGETLAARLGAHRRLNVAEAIEMREDAPLADLPWRDTERAGHVCVAPRLQSDPTP
jgi:serine/threonine protein kinase